jgi:adenosylcobinamide-GDP ribazoletransferase
MQMFSRIAMHLKQHVRYHLLAVQFFTRIPITGKLAAWVGFSPDMLRHSSGHFPAVGLWVSLLCSGALWLAWIATANPMLTVILSTAASIWITGAFHEDGLADLADGLGGAVSRDRALEIMKDSRLGTYGTVALLLMLLTKIVALTALLDYRGLQVCAWLVLAHVTSRFLLLWMIRRMHHVGDAAGAKSKPLADDMPGSALLIGHLWCLAIWMLVYEIAFVFPQRDPRIWPVLTSWLGGVFASLLAFTYMWRLLRRRLDGFTGDALGATQQVTEVAFYLGALVVLARWA